MPAPVSTVPNRIHRQDKDQRPVLMPASDDGMGVAVKGPASEPWNGVVGSGVGEARTEASATVGLGEEVKPGDGKGPLSVGLLVGS